MGYRGELKIRFKKIGDKDKIYNLGDKVIMKKVHPCGSSEFEIIRLGADIKIKCTSCSRVIMLPRVDFNKKIKKVVKNEKKES